SGRVSPATGDQDVKVVSVALIGPVGVKVDRRVATVSDIAELRGAQVHDWLRVHPFIILLTNETPVARKLRHERFLFASAHGRCNYNRSRNAQRHRGLYPRK